MDVFAKLRIKKVRGEKAKQLLENETFVDAIQKIESEIDKAWKESGSDEEEVRRNAYLMHRLLQNLKGQLTRIVSTGNQADKALLKIK